MALIQSFSAELSTYAGAARGIRDDGTSIAKIASDITTIKQHDEEERHYFHSLNDRLEELLRHLHDLERANEELRHEIFLLIKNWGIDGEHCIKFAQSLNEITEQLSQQNYRRIFDQAQTKIFEDEIQSINHITTCYIDIITSYKDKYHILIDIVNDLENELNKVETRLKISNEQVQSHDDDYKNELKKFRSYLNNWSNVTLEKQNLLNDIQSIRERYHLRLAYNQEEINEWKRLLNRISNESKTFYQDYLETVKQQLQIDYEKMIKEQQIDVEMELKSRLNEIEENTRKNIFIDENRKEIVKFENRLIEQTQQYDNLNSEIQTLVEENKRKRRMLNDLENELNNKMRHNFDQHVKLEQDTNAIREEYYALKDDLDQLAYTLRFTIEEELKIYEALLNSLSRQPVLRPATVQTMKIPTISTSEVKTIDHKQNWHNELQTMRTSTQETIAQKHTDIDISQTQKTMLGYDQTCVQRKVNVTRRYKGNITIKLVDINGFFVDIENIGNQARDLTGWYIEQTVDGRRIHFTFPTFELGSNQTVRIYGKLHQQSSKFIEDEPFLKLFSTNFNDWDTGRHIHTELYNSDKISKALFEQRMKD